ncbi:hypothetical protein [Deinococcus pimensis]|uniref:hypothetical protein n=1 Tax=Deinococcus pimensis TaxID=309888 RepID=UPI0004892914|nr:hypothetical protein [Deinococcus pimensis]
MLRIPILVTLQAALLASLLMACGQPPVPSTTPTPAAETAQGDVEALKKVRSNATPGSLDPSYGDGGQVTITGQGRAVAVTPAGGVYLADYTATRPYGTPPSDTLVRRLKPNGKPDHAFGQGGTLTLPAADVVTVYPDGRILLALRGRPAPGGTAFEFRRFLPAGQPDPTFGTGGASTITVGGAPSTVLSPRQVLAEPTGALTFFTGNAITRLTLLGRRDIAFGTNGELRVKYPFEEPAAPAATGGPTTGVTGLARRPDGSYAVYALYNPISDTPDASYTAVDFLMVYSAQGQVLTSRRPTVGGRFVSAYGLDVWDDGAIVTSSSVFLGDLTLRRVSPDLSTDQYVVKPGGFPSDVKTLPEGRLLTITVGLFDPSNPTGIMSRLVRYDANGQPDLSFGDGGAVNPKFFVDRVFVTQDGRLIVTGDGVVARYLN